MLDLVQWASYEFQGVASAMLSTEADKIWHAAPPKPRAGTQAYADGTNWNPGAGEGFYEYTSAGWVPMFSAASWFGAWTTFTPVVSCTAGAFASASANCRYKLIGKSCLIAVTVSVPNIGTATGYPVCTLPIAAAGAGVQPYLMGREGATTGYTLAGIISSSNLTITQYNNAPPNSNGMSCSVNGVYETV